VLHVQSKALLASLPTTLEVLYLHFPNFFKVLASSRLS